MGIQVAALLSVLFMGGSGNAFAGRMISFDLGQWGCKQEAPTENSSAEPSYEHCIERLQQECRNELENSPEIQKTKDRLKAYAQTDSTFDPDPTSVDGSQSRTETNPFRQKEFCFDDNNTSPRRHCHRIRVYDGTQYTATCSVKMGIAPTHSVTFRKTAHIRKVTSTTSNACIAVENDLTKDPAVVQSIIRSTTSGPLSPPSECWVEYHTISRN